MYFLVGIYCFLNLSIHENESWDTNEKYIVSNYHKKNCYTQTNMSNNKYLCSDKQFTSDEYITIE